MPDAAPHQLHFGIAEQGKLHALRGEHDKALSHYRAALRVAVGSRAPEVFFRHYTQCVMESLELAEEYEAVVEYYQEADAHYETLDVDGNLYDRDRAAILERLGAVLLKSGDVEGARNALEQATRRAGAGGAPLAKELLGWLARGYSVAARQVTESQRRHDYFIVRPDRVDAARALPVPESLQQVAGIGGTGSRIGGG